MWSAHVLTGKQTEDAFRLRYKTFAETLKWIPENPRKMDVDQFDLDSIHVGVYRDKELLATCRVIPYGKPWMLTEIFPYLTVPIEPDSMELSRLSINSAFSFAERAQAFGMLVYKTSQLVTQTYVYSVTTVSRAHIYQRFGVVFDELARHETCAEKLTVMRIRVKETNWRGIAESTLIEEYHG